MLLSPTTLRCSACKRDLCFSSMAKITAAKPGQRWKQGDGRWGLVSGARTLKPGCLRQTCSAVGLRHWFLLQMKRRFIGMWNCWNDISNIFGICLNRGICMKRRIRHSTLPYTKMPALTKKQYCIIDVALKRLHGVKSFLVQKSMKDFVGVNFLLRELHLTDNRTALLTDVGLAHMQMIVATLDKADFFDGLTDYSDIWNACWRVFEDLLSKGVVTDNAVEFLKLVRERLDVDIGSHTYAVPLFGIEMEGIEEITLGSMKIVRPSISHLDTAGVNHAHADLLSVIEATKQYLWLFGSAKGTPKVAERKFHGQAQLAAGMLAVYAASMFESGASAFRIGVIMSPEQAYGPARWISWDNNNLELTTHGKFIRAQQFKVNGELLDQFATASGFARAFKIFESEQRTELEEAITKGIYWYSDAHRDSVSVMKLIKYWSCVETFFSADKNGITKAVSTGLASVLVFGGYNFVPATEYGSLKRKITKLYSLRSRAVHGAAYEHVSERDASDLSQWVAWMLINMVMFVERGYTKVAEIKKITDQLDIKFDAGEK